MRGVLRLCPRMAVPHHPAELDFWGVPRLGSLPPGSPTAGRAGSPAPGPLELRSRLMLDLSVERFGDIVLESNMLCTSVLGI